MLKEAGRIAPGDQWIEGRRRVEAIERKPHPTFATVVNITVKYVGIPIPDDVAEWLEKAAKFHAENPPPVRTYGNHAGDDRSVC